MSDRLSPLDVSFLYLEERTTPMHVGSVMLFRPPEGGLDYARLVRHVEARIALVPRYRQRVRFVPGRIANPVWVDDERFDISYHVRRSALPRPGSRTQLEELVARLQSRRLDRSRPLWELIVVEGLDDGGFAVVTKVHQTLVDGVHAVDLGQVVLDDDEDGHEPPLHTWRPGREPSFVELVAGAVTDTLRRPQQLVDTARAGLGDLLTTGGKAAEALGGLALAARTATRPQPRSPLNVDIGGHRRFVMLATDLEDYRRIRARHIAGRAAEHDHSDDSGTTVNDVVLATLAGALRTWLQGRGLGVGSGSMVRALVPMSVKAQDPSDAGAIGSRVASLLVDLPTGEPSPLMRLHQVAYQTRGHREAGQALSAPAIAGIAGFAPPTLHSLGARVASGLSRRLFNLVVTNVPGPQRPLFLDASRLVASYPVVPLAKGQALAVGLTSYDGGVHYGLNGDRDAMPDLEELGRCIVEALAELAEAAG
ncbi:MAG TPA: wax ester/triacylglycerol synthase family O-acyltransferase [Kineosporiaceae bacterium]|nr:wax ester/triacylglycerol synthase family O-acyltransferase [Kineosporiaceae bacterium]